MRVNPPLRRAQRVARPLACPCEMDRGSKAILAPFGGRLIRPVPHTAVGCWDPCRSVLSLRSSAFGALTDSRLEDSGHTGTRRPRKRGEVTAHERPTVGEGRSPLHGYWTNQARQQRLVFGEGDRVRVDQRIAASFQNPLLAGREPPAFKVRNRSAGDWSQPGYRARTQGEAYEIYGAALERWPLDLSFRRNTAWLLVDMARFELAPTQLKLLLDRVPNLVEWRTRGVAHGTGSGAAAAG